MQLTLTLPFALTIVTGLAAAVLIYFVVLLARNEAVYVPLPQETIDSMLKMAEIGPDDVLFDLGSGDGRVVITAARRYGIRAVGIEKSGMLAWLSKRAVRRNSLEDRIQIVNRDFFGQDLSEATVVTVYLSKKINARLEPKLRKELKQGTRIVSADHTFNFEERTKVKTGHFWTHLYVS
jgi:precorrin-6B methylase 2